MKPERWEVLTIGRNGDDVSVDSIHDSEPAAVERASWIDHNGPADIAATLVRPCPYPGTSRWTVSTRTPGGTVVCYRTADCARKAAAMSARAVNRFARVRPSPYGQDRTWAAAVDGRYVATITVDPA